MFKGINTKVKKKKKGFTLIELIIVIAIIGILAIIAIPRFLNIKTDANIKADIANAKAISDTTSSLIAQGTITLPTGSSTKILTPATGTDADALAIKGALQGVPTGKNMDGANFLVTIDSASGIVVSLSSTTGTGSSAVTTTKKVYPKDSAEDPYNK